MTEPDIRKVVVLKEVVMREGGRDAAEPIDAG